MKRVLFLFALLSAFSFTSVMAQAHNFEPAPDEGGGSSPSTYTSIDYKTKVVDNGVLRATVYYTLTHTKKYSDHSIISTVCKFTYGSNSLLDNDYTIIWESDFSQQGNKVYFSFEATKPGPYPGFLILSSICGPVIMD